MVKKKTNDSGRNLEIPTLVISRDEAKDKLEDRIQKGIEIKNRQITTFDVLEVVKNDFHKWSKYNSDLLASIFSSNTSETIVNEYHGFAGFFSVGGEVRLSDEIKELHDDIQTKINKLESFMERLELFPEPEVEEEHVKEDIPLTKRPSELKEIFIVHGHDDAAKNELARFIERIGHKPIILHEQPNQGKTIIEKLEANSNVPFTVILLTPDDIGGIKSETDRLKYRARQNVILELGFYLGKLGRSKVSVLYKPELELPTDIQGLAYIEMDRNEGWKLALTKELLSSGFIIDMNKLI